MNKDLRALLRKVRKTKGWEVAQRKNGHMRVTGPNGARVDCAYSPSCPHAIRNIERDLKRAGWKP